MSTHPPATYTSTDAMAARDALAWQAGYDAGSRQRHRRLTVAIVGVFLVLGRIHWSTALAWLVVVAILSPLLVLTLAVELIVRQHRRWHDWRRTLAVSLTWAVGAGLVLLAIVAGSAWLLVLVVGVVAWTIEGCRRGRRESSQ